MFIFKPSQNEVQIDENNQLYGKSIGDEPLDFLNIGDENYFTKYDINLTFNNSWFFNNINEGQFKNGEIYYRCLYIKTDVSNSSEFFDSLVFNVVNDYTPTSTDASDISEKLNAAVSIKGWLETIEHKAILTNENDKRFYISLDSEFDHLSLESAEWTDEVEVNREISSHEYIKIWLKIEVTSDSTLLDLDEFNYIFSLNDVDFVVNKKNSRMSNSNIFTTTLGKRIFTETVNDISIDVKKITKHNNVLNVFYNEEEKLKTLIFKKEQIPSENKYLELEYDTLNNVLNNSSDYYELYMEESDDYGDYGDYGDVIDYLNDLLEKIIIVDIFDSNHNKNYSYIFFNQLCVENDEFKWKFGYIFIDLNDLTYSVLENLESGYENRTLRHISNVSKIVYLHDNSYIKTITKYKDLFNLLTIESNIYTKKFIPSKGKVWEHDLIEGESKIFFSSLPNSIDTSPNIKSIVSENTFEIIKLMNEDITIQKNKLSKKEWVGNTLLNYIDFASAYGNYIMVPSTVSLKKKLKLENSTKLIMYTFRPEIENTSIISFNTVSTDDLSLNVMSSDVENKNIHNLLEMNDVNNQGIINVLSMGSEERCLTLKYDSDTHDWILETNSGTSTKSDGSIPFSTKYDNTLSINYNLFSLSPEKYSMSFSIFVNNIKLFSEENLVINVKNSDFDFLYDMSIPSKISSFSISNKEINKEYNENMFILNNRFNKLSVSEENIKTVLDTSDYGDYGDYGDYEDVKNYDLDRNTNRNKDFRYFKDITLFDSSKEISEKYIVPLKFYSTDTSNSNYNIDLMNKFCDLDFTKINSFNPSLLFEDSCGNRLNHMILNIENNTISLLIEVTDLNKTIRVYYDNNIIKHSSPIELEEMYIMDKLVEKQNIIYKDVNLFQAGEENYFIKTEKSKNIVEITDDVILNNKHIYSSDKVDVLYDDKEFINKEEYEVIDEFIKEKASLFLPGNISVNEVKSKGS